MKRVLSVVLAAALLVLAGGCGEMTEPPTIEVTADETAIPYTVGLNSWNGAVIDREDTLQYLARQEDEFPYVALGETIAIRFRGPAPESVELRDDVIHEDGSRPYGDQAAKVRDIAFQGGTGRFALAVHPSVPLGTHTGDTAPGAVHRGFRLTCSWGDNTCEYGFILRTDAQTAAE